MSERFPDVKCDGFLPREVSLVLEALGGKKDERMGKLISLILEEYKFCSETKDALIGFLGGIDDSQMNAVLSAKKPLMLLELFLFVQKATQATTERITTQLRRKLGAGHCF